MTTSEILTALMQRGLTQAEVSRRIETTTQTISRWATGKAVPSKMLGIRLQKLYDEICRD